MSGNGKHRSSRVVEAELSAPIPFICAIASQDSRAYCRKSAIVNMLLDINGKARWPPRMELGHSHIPSGDKWGHGRQTDCI